MTRQASYFIGVDTGGTYTDAAVIEEAGHKVVASPCSAIRRSTAASGVGAVFSIAKPIAWLGELL